MIRRWRRREGRLAGGSRGGAEGKIVGFDTRNLCAEDRAPVVASVFIDIFGKYDYLLPLASYLSNFLS